MLIFESDGEDTKTNKLLDEDYFYTTHKMKSECLLAQTLTTLI